MLSGCSKSSALPAVHRARSKKFDPCIKTTLLASQMLLAVVDASKRITHHALEWLLKNVAQPGDSVTLLAISPLASPNWRIWEFPRLAGDCAPIPQPHKPEDGIKESCRAVIQQLQLLCESKQIKVKLKVVQTGIRGVAAVEAKKLQATWVVLDRNLKKETKYCIDELQCNVVTVNHLGSKILRLNLKYFPAGEADMPIQDLPIISPKVNSLSMEPNSSPSQQQITSSASPDPGTPFTATDPSTSSCSSSEPSTSPCLSYSAERKSPGLKSPRKSPRRTILGTGAEQPILRKPASPSVDPRRQEYDKNCIPMSSFSESKGGRSLPDYTFSSPTDYRNNLKPLAEEEDENCGDLFTLMQGERQRQRQGVSLERTSSVRKAVSMAKQSLPGPPPLCSICQHQAPVFGRPPKRFTYAELDLATGGFCRANFLAEGGFGSVHRGVLSDGQAIAVKQHKPASAQGDKEFCAEVEVLSCAQHRNVVMLIGYCIEDSRRLLVYEFICNGSLDAHLYGRNRPTLEWCSRQKIAIGAARGLRYLHEECRVGCIVHRDMRPNNILLTHDFEPLVGDFGLARWQPDGRLGVETRVIGTFGYLAPEYTQSGQITEKADVYSLGVVLLELVTGRKAIDISRCRGEQCLVEWARPLLGERAYHELVDPRLGDCFDRREAVYMLHAASLCTRRDPYARPRMSQVLHILEGNLPSDPVDWDTPGRPSFSRPTRCSPQTKLSYEALRATYKDRISHLPSSLDDFA